MKKVNLSATPTLVAARPPTLRIKSRIKAAMISPNHNEMPTRRRATPATKQPR